MKNNKQFKKKIRKFRFCKSMIKKVKCRKYRQQKIISLRINMINKNKGKNMNRKILRQKTQSALSI